MGASSLLVIRRHFRNMCAKYTKEMWIHCTSVTSVKFVFRHLTHSKIIWETLTKSFPSLATVDSSKECIHSISFLFHLRNRVIGFLGTNKDRMVVSEQRTAADPFNLEIVPKMSQYLCPYFRKGCSKRVVS